MFKGSIFVVYRWDGYTQSNEGGWGDDTKPEAIQHLSTILHLKHMKYCIHTQQCMDTAQSSTLAELKSKQQPPHASALVPYSDSADPLVSDA